MYQSLIDTIKERAIDEATPGAEGAAAVARDAYKEQASKLTARLKKINSSKAREFQLLADKAATLADKILG